MLKRVIALLLRFFVINANFDCPGTKSIEPRYYLIEKCQRSKLSVLAFANHPSLLSCQRFGLNKKGLALNFSPPEAYSSGDVEIPEYNCQVLKCAESEIGLSLVNDTRYDYYSLFARPMPKSNAICVPGVGMLILLKQKLNNSQANDICSKHSGHLADITSESRTDSFAQLLAGAGVDAAYAGMTRDNTTTFRSVTGDFLDCNSYRAWAPGHPKRLKKKVYGCVTITRARTWRTVTCDTRLPALCELISRGPYIIGSIEAANMMNDTARTQNASNIQDNKNI